MKNIINWIKEWWKSLYQEDKRDNPPAFKLDVKGTDYFITVVESFFNSEQVKQQFDATDKLKENYKPPKCYCCCECGITKNSSKNRNRSDSGKSSSNCPSNHDL